MMNNLLVTT